MPENNDANISNEILAKVETNKIKNSIKHIFKQEGYRKKKEWFELLKEKYGLEIAEYDSFLSSLGHRRLLERGLNKKIIETLEMAYTGKYDKKIKIIKETAKNLDSIISNTSNVVKLYQRTENYLIEHKYTEAIFREYLSTKSKKDKSRLFYALSVLLYWVYIYKKGMSKLESDNKILFLLKNKTIFEVLFDSKRKENITPENYLFALEKNIFWFNYEDLKKIYVGIKNCGSPSIGRFSQLGEFINKVSIINTSTELEKIKKMLVLRPLGEKKELACISIDNLKFIILAKENTSLKKKKPSKSK